VADETSPFYSDAQTIWSSYNVVGIQQLVKDVGVTLGDNQSLGLTSNLTDDEAINAKPYLMAVLYTSGSTGVPERGPDYSQNGAEPH
jgi:acyl-coenzyme A synthetase/AMP-(fatty) acid ligase